MAEQTTQAAEATTQTTANAGETPPAKTWHESLSPDLKDVATLKKFNDVEALAKSYVSLEKTLGGKNTISIPDQHANDDDWNGVFKKLGLPESVDKYELKVGETANKEFIDEFKKTAHAAGMLPKQAQKLVDWFSNKEKTTLESTKTMQQTTVNQAIDGLKKEYGQAFDSTIQKAKAAVEHYGADVPEFKDFLNKATVDGVPLTSHPSMVKFMVKVADSLKEGQFKGESFYSNTLSPAEAMKKANSIISDYSHPYHIKTHPNHLAAVQEVSELFQQSN